VRSTVDTELTDGPLPPAADRAPLSPGSPHRTLGAVRLIVDGGLVSWTMRSRGRPSSREGGSLPGIAWAAIVLAIVGLGTWGFLALHHSPRLNAPESLYDAAKLYTIDLGPANGSSSGPDWQIWVAFVAATVLVLRGVGALVRGHARRFATSRMLKRHVIVCGAGVHGAELARSLSGDHDVVVIDTDPVSPGLQGVHGRYEWRLIGDAVSPRMLEQAGISRAHRVVAVTGDDVVNSEIVSTVRGLARGGRALDRVDVQVQVEDPSLSRFLEEEIERDDPAEATGASPVVSPFSANAIAADQLLDRIGDGWPSLLLAGDHPLIDLVVLTVLRRQRARSIELLESAATSPSTPVRISIYGPAAEDRVRRLKERWRPESQLLLLDGRDSAPPADGGAELDEWLRLPGRGDHAVVVCIDQLEGIVLTLGVARALGGGRLVTRVSTVAPNAFDDHVERHTASSDALATTSVESIAELGSDPRRAGGDQPDEPRLSGLERLKRELNALPGSDPRESDRRARGILSRRALRVRADRTWRIRPVEQPLLEALLEVDPPAAGPPAARPPAVREPAPPTPGPPAAPGPAAAPRVPLSAMLRAGLRLELDSPENLLTAAQRLTATGDAAAFTAWCEYVRRGGGGEDPRRHIPTGDPAADRLLELAAVVRTRPEITEPSGPVEEMLAAAAHITIFAGAAGSMPAATRQSLSELLVRSLGGYDGVLLSGGTDAGMPGIVADAAYRNGLSGLVGYVPAGQPASSLYPHIQRTRPVGNFTIHEPLQMWEQLLGAGRRPAEVTLLACPGGEILWQEVAVARALGARIGWVDPADQSSVALDDRFVLGAGGIVPLPPDAMTIRAFVMPSMLQDGLRDALARSLHEDYRRHQLWRKPAGDLSLAHWEELPESLRASNLALAADIPNKLALVGLRLTRPGESGGRLSLTDDQVQMLAAVEHGRWNAERLQAGWRLGARQVGRSTSPYLVPWADLPVDIRQYDVETVRNIAAALAGAGCGVTRV
jgi:TrkA-N domain/RyR domain